MDFMAPFRERLAYAHVACSGITKTGLGSNRLRFVYYTENGGQLPILGKPREWAGFVLIWV